MVKPRSRARIFAGALLAALAFAPALAAAAEFAEEIERDFPLRTRGLLQVTNMRGDIAVQGWSMDRIRVRARRVSVGDSEAEARKNASAADFRYDASGGVIELSAEYGQGLSLEERLRERAHPRTRIEMTVFAPPGLSLRVWAVDGKVSVRGWGASLDVRTSSGPISIEGAHGDNVSLLCPSCPVSAQGIRASVRCMGGSGLIRLKGIKGPQIYVESSTGRLELSDIDGEQLYVSKSGEILGDALRGRIEFHAQDAPVRIAHASGFLSGKSVSGDVAARMVEWWFADKAVIESASGNVTLSLPSVFSGDVDFWSVSGKVQSAFTVHGTGVVRSGESSGGSRLQGRIGNGGELLKILSERGNIQILKGG